MQASFGPNLAGPPLNYLQNDIIIANPLDGCSTLTNAEQVKGRNAYVLPTCFKLIQEV